MKKLKQLLWLFCFIIGTASLSAQQQYTLKGEVLDQIGEPLTGVSVIVKGPTLGVTTDIDGNFAIKVKNGDLVQFSYIGCKPQEVKVTGQNDIKITMEDDSEVLDEVVVIGYGSMRKKDLTGSVVQINPDKIADQNPGSVQDVLRGVPGLQIGYDASAKGAGASIRLRGQNSLGTNASPMIVLDGMAFYGELSEINPDDIAQIDVLKDASSTAIYGAQAAAGVIIITTKKGKDGKPTITLNANLGVSSKSAYVDFYRDAATYDRFREDWYKANYSYGQGADGLYGYYNAVDKNGNALYPQGYFDSPRNMTDAQRQAWASNIGVQGVGLADGEEYLSLYARRLGMSNSYNVMQNYLDGKTVDWYDATFRTGIKQDYNASISGATERVNYYMSVGYLNNEGAVQGNEYKAFRANLKLNTKVTKWLEFGVNANFQDRTDGDIQVDLNPQYWYNNMLRNSLYASMYDADGNYEQYPMGGRVTKGGYNYYFDRQYYDLDKGYTTLNTIFNVKVTLPFGFTYQFNIAPRYQWFHDRYWMKASLPDASASSRGVNRETEKRFEWNLNNTITWDRTFNDVHRFTVTLVQEAEEHKFWKDRLEARNITPTDALGSHYTEGANKEQSKFYSTDTHYTAASYLGRLFYSYDNKYMITGSFRRDGYSGFGRNNIWGNFGAVGLGWNFSDEKFMESTRSWLENAKLRLSWGSNGNREFGDVYKTLANLKVDNKMVYYGNDGQPVIVNGLRMDRLGAPDLQWERTESWNVGLDFSVLNRRLSGSIDWYIKNTKDMIMSQRLPEFSGFTSIAANLGEVQNSGFEITLNSINIDTKNFQWTTSAGFSLNKSKIKHLYYTYDEDGNELSDTSNGWYINKPINEIWDYETDGVWRNTPEDIAAAKLVGQKPGDPKVINHYTEDDKILADGTRVPVYNDKDKVYLGTKTPPIYWTLRNDFTLFQDFSIGVSLYSYMGHKSSEGYWLNQYNGGSVMTNANNVQQHNYWTPDGKHTNDYCRLEAQGPEGLSGGVNKIYNRNFVRLDNITLGYTLPRKLTSRWQIERVHVTAGCNNVCTISGWKYGDPETGGLANRTFNFGLTLTL